jgi:hypothetical protein
MFICQGYKGLVAFSFIYGRLDFLHSVDGDCKLETRANPSARQHQITKRATSGKVWALFDGTANNLLRGRQPAEFVCLAVISVGNL